MTLKSNSVLLILLLIAMGCSAKPKTTGNRGHRLGADYLEGAFLENTLESFSETINQGLHKSKDLKYFELDIRETKDNELIIFHDRYVSRRLIPSTPANNAVLEKGLLSKLRFSRVRNYTLKELKTLELRQKASIPSLEEFLNLAVQNRVKKRIFIEIKETLTDKGITQLFLTTNKYRFDLNLSLLAYPYVFATLKKHHYEILNELYQRDIYIYETKKSKNKRNIYSINKRNTWQ